MSRTDLTVGSLLHCQHCDRRLAAPPPVPQDPICFDCQAVAALAQVLSLDGLYDAWTRVGGLPDEARPTLGWTVQEVLEAYGRWLG